MAGEPSVEVSNDRKASRTNRTGSLWLSLVVVLLNGSWAIYYFQYNDLPMPLTTEQAGKRGFSEALSLVHVKNLTGFGPHPVGSDTLDLAIQAFPKDAAYLNITIANYVELEIVCGLGHATGEWAKSGNSQSPLGTQQIHLSDDEPSQFMDVGGEESVPIDWPNMQVTEDSNGTTKKSQPSSGTGGGVKRKCKTSDINKEIRECICLMADSVNEVANAIKNSITSPTQIRNMYTELMFELRTISGFSEDDVDTIYDNLSRNPTLIPSFLSKTTDSKVRWMRKELGK